MNVTEQHLHHMAKRHHSTMRKFDALRERLSGMTEHAVRTLEVGAGAWLGGLVEGRTNNGTLGPVPINLAAGLTLSALGFLDVAGDYSEHLNSFGAGFLGSYAASHGYAFGKRWRETGKLLPSKAAAAPLPTPSPEAMAQMAAQMHAAGG